MNDAGVLGAATNPQDRASVECGQALPYSTSRGIKTKMGEKRSRAAQHRVVVMAIRVKSYNDVNGSYFTVQHGHTVQGRWKTLREVRFNIEERMADNSPEAYHVARLFTKAVAEEYAREWEKKLKKLLA